MRCNALKQWSDPHLPTVQAYLPEFSTLVHVSKTQLCKHEGCNRIEASIRYSLTLQFLIDKIPAVDIS
jgi:hypothetical protein